MPDDATPLRDCDCENLDAVLQSAATVQECLRKCANAGWSMPDYEAQVQQNAALARGLKGQFFPHRP